MGSNSFGNIFRITTWGESHGKAIGVVIDGCPAGLEFCKEDIQIELALRQPGRNSYTSPRCEKDQADILSGVFEGKTTGTPISIIIFNHDVDSSKYEPIKDLLRPGHANFTYLQKYGIFDYRGGGRASARETACRVAAGAIAKKILLHYKIQLVAYVKEVAGIIMEQMEIEDFISFKKQVLASPVFCPDEQAAKKIMKTIEEMKEEGDSVGGVVELYVQGVPIGLGDPIYEKLEANLAKAMLTLPASKGIEFGAGFMGSKMKGSEHNDAFTVDEQGNVLTKTNHAGGLLGGISNGMPLLLKVAFKPTSSIKKNQQTIDIHKEKQEFNMPEGSRHDPCVALRAVPVVEAMGAIVLVDALLLHRTTRL
ncbi:MAG: chorismate synthase [Verrucomicrobia bacterium]|nr:chorismate synthase [Verrucomicrobiota bacterium]MBS0646919.1 chorismate synthase [Verrucomicrobiota bacterium]